MNVFFRPLLTVDFDHPYYTDACRDFGFFVPARTADLLRKGRLLARERGGVLHLLYEADENGSRLVDFTGQTLIFGLRLLNSQFYNFTEAPIVGRGLTPSYANSTTPSSIDPPLRVRLVSGLYAHMPEDQGRPVTLVLSVENGPVVETQVLTEAGAAPPFDLRALPDGAFVVTEDYGAGAVHPLRVLLDADLAGVAPWGLVAVKVDNGFYGAPAKLKVGFSAREGKLDYYVVAPAYGDTEFSQLDIDDTGFTEQARAEVKFDKVPQAQWTPSDLKPQQLGAPVERIALFRSLVPVEYRQKSLRGINLHRNGDILVEHLPQPGAHQSRSQFVIHLSKS